MMVRTIQHPGVQIQESEIGSYTSTVVMNNAYIMGFADRGPIYDYSWITTTREFTKIYGEPQTEAEKYLFTAVQSVLQNGGTPIVARMPYDNKQCKAYKALKLKWNDVTPNVDTDLRSPLVPLADVTARIEMDRPFSQILTSSSVTIGNSSASTSDLQSLTISQLAKQLNPYKSGSEVGDGELYEDIIQDLRINGAYPSGLGIDQEAVSSFVESLYLDASRNRTKYSKYDEGMNRPNFANWDNFDENFFDMDHGDLYKIVNKYIPVSANVAYYDDDELSANGTVLIDIFNSAASDSYYNNSKIYNANSIPREIKATVETTISSAVPSSLYSFRSSDNGRTYELAFVSGEVEQNISGETTIVQMTAADAINMLTAASSIVDGDTVAVVQFVSGALSEIPFLVTPKVRFDEDDTYYKIYRQNAVGAEINSYLAYARKNDAVDIDEFSKIFGDEPIEVGGDSKNAIFGEVEAPESASAVVALEEVYPLFAETQNGMIVTATTVTTKKVSPTNSRGFHLVGFYNGYKTSPAISGHIPSGSAYSMLSAAASGYYETQEELTDYLDSITIPSGGVSVWSHIEIDSHPDGLPELKVTNPEAGSYGTKEHYIIDKNIKTGPGRWTVFNFADYQCTTDDCEIDDYYKTVTFTDSLADIPAIDISDEMLYENEQLVWLKTIYNNPYFLRLDEKTYTALESKLMSTPEMGFKTALYLDAESCEISNDQYDDLVTVRQFKAVNRTLDKYGQDIDDANYIIVDKQKTVVQGAGGNIGFFTTVVDPFDALKVQRLLVNPKPEESSEREVYNGTMSKTVKFDHSTANIGKLDYWAYESADAWNKIYDDLMDSMDCLQRVRNADGVYIGEPNKVDDQRPNILDSWSIPLTGSYYEDSISKTLMRKFPGISMADVTADDLINKEYQPSIIDHNYMTHILVAVCKTTIDPSNGKIVVNLVETFFGSLFNERNMQNGRSLFIGDVINENSDYIEFYRNDFVSAGENGAYMPPEYRRTEVNQLYIKDSEELKNAAQLCGIDPDEYHLEAVDEATRKQAEKEYYEDLEKRHIFAIDKKEVCIYSVHWEAELTSFSKKESQKIIANTAGLYSVSDGKTVNVANNFLIDMDRCIKFIKNIDEVPIHFVCDAGISTIAQFCDNVFWNPNKRSVVGEKEDPVTGKKTGVKIYEKTGGWITQPFDPDNDPDGDDREIRGYEDVATWRKVVEKLGELAGDIRKDCFAIIDAPRQLTLDGAAPKIRRSKFTNDFDKTIGRALRYISGLNNSYMAGYYNWLRTTDQYTGRNIWIPPTSKIIGNYCYLNIINLPWLAPAGMTYGVITGCHAVSHNPDSQEEDQIYLKSWNYFKQYPLEGIITEGQKTLLGKESAFERVNVRLLFLDLERFAYNVARSFKYTVNNEYTREQFVQTLRPKFEDYASRGGIYEYLIKCDTQNNTPETIDNNELRGDIFIKPARLIEYVLLNFRATSTSTDFSELLLG